MGIRRLKYRKHVVIFLAGVLLLSCSVRRSLPVAGPLSLNEHEQQGEQIFMLHCQRCHPNGEGGLGPAINPAPSFAKKFQVRHGIGTMPAFKEDHISDEELDQLIGYLKRLKKNS